MKRAVVRLAFGFALSALGACSPLSAGGGPPGPVVTVFAAASLNDAFTQLAVDFESANPGAEVVLNFGASQALRVQIEEGAQADVFASANLSEVQALVDAGLVATDRVQVFARNRLVVVLSPGNPGHVALLQDLSRPGVRIVVADPAVPAGKYTRQALDSMAGDPSWGSAFRQAVLANVVSQEETVRAVLTKVEVGEADAGFVYLSDARHALQLSVIDLLPGHSPMVMYPIAALRSSKNAAAAQAFIDFVLSTGGQRILEAHGFLAATD